MIVVPMTQRHSEAVLEIYQHALDDGNSSFDTVAPTWQCWDATHLPEHRFVALGEDSVLGWIACTATSARLVYAGVVENSLYVHPDGQGRGVGRALLEAVIDSTEAAGIWTIQAGIFPENAASLALHGKFGFRVVGTRERMGQQHGRWRDVVLLERRSAVV